MVILGSRGTRELGQMYCISRNQISVDASNLVKVHHLELGYNDALDVDICQF